MCMNCQSRQEQTCRSRTSSTPAHISRRGHASFRRGNQNQWQLQCRKCHACHAKWKSMLPSATPATQGESRCQQVPRLPGRVRVDVAKCHACRAKSRQQGPERVIRASPSAISATPATRSESRCPQVPRLPCKVHVHVTTQKWSPMSPSADVAKCHAYHAKSCGVHGVNWDPSAPPEPV